MKYPGYMLATAAGLFSGAVVGAVLYSAAVSLVVRGWRPGPEAGTLAAGLWTAFHMIAAGSCFFGGGIAGLNLSQSLLLRNVSARCVKCGGGAACRPGRPTTYHCRECGHDHKSVWNVR